MIYSHLQQQTRLNFVEQTNQIFNYGHLLIQKKRLVNNLQRKIHYFYMYICS